MPVTHTPTIRLYATARWTDSAPDPEVARDQARHLGAAIDPDACGASVLSVTVTGNRRTYVSVRREGPGFHLRVHWALLTHPITVADGVAHVLRHGRYPAPLLDRIHLSARDPGTSEPGRRLDPIGYWRDLTAVLGEVIAFADRPIAASDFSIGWGQDGRGRARRTMRLGRADADRRAIVVHPALDAAHVPDTVVEMVVWHELCHCLEPPLTVAEARGRREHRVHHRGFRQLEHRYPHLREANRWVRQNLERLLTER